MEEYIPSGVQAYTGDCVYSENELSSVHDQWSGRCKNHSTRVNPPRLTWFLDLKLNSWLKRQSKWCCSSITLRVRFCFPDSRKTRYYRIGYQMADIAASRVISAVFTQHVKPWIFARLLPWKSNILVEFYTEFVPEIAEFEDFQVQSKSKNIDHFTL